MHLSIILFLFTFIMPLILWSQPPVKNTDNKPASKKETTPSSKKKKAVKTTDTKKQDVY